VFLELHKLVIQVELSSTEVLQARLILLLAAQLFWRQALDQRMQTEALVAQ
jgi:hypothetical protein